MVKVRRGLTFEEYTCVCLCYGGFLEEGCAATERVKEKYPNIEEITESFCWVDDDGNPNYEYGTAEFDDVIPFKYIGDPKRLSPCENNGRQDLVSGDEWCKSGKCCLFVDGKCVFGGGFKISNTRIVNDYEDLFEVNV